MRSIPSSVVQEAPGEICHKDGQAESMTIDGEGEGKPRTDQVEIDQLKADQTKPEQSHWSLEEKPHQREGQLLQRYLVKKRKCTALPCYSATHDVACLTR